MHKNVIYGLYLLKQGNKKTKKTKLKIFFENNYFQIR